MTMKAMTMTLSVVVASIVILITGMVVITIFGSGMTGMRTLSEARSYCLIQLDLSCHATNQPPLNWKYATIRLQSGLQSCEQITGRNGCDGTAGTGGGGGDSENDGQEIAILNPVDVSGSVDESILVAKEVASELNVLGDGGDTAYA